MEDVTQKLVEAAKGLAKRLDTGSAEVKPDESEAEKGEEEDEDEKGAAEEDLDLLTDMGSDSKRKEKSDDKKEDAPEGQRRMITMDPN